MQNVDCYDALNTENDKRSTIGSPRRFLFNAAFMTTPGVYEYRIIDDEAAREWVKENPNWMSTIGYSEACQALGNLLGITVPLNRVKASFEPGDEGLVFRLSQRVDPGRKGKVGFAYQVENHEFGILRFIGPVVPSSQGFDGVEGDAVGNRA